MGRSLRVMVLVTVLVVGMALPAMAVQWITRENAEIQCISGDYSTRITANGEHKHTMLSTSVEYTLQTNYRTTYAGFNDGPSNAWYYLKQGSLYSNWSYTGSQAWCS
jgi:hypothetical protein